MGVLEVKTKQIYFVNTKIHFEVFLSIIIKNGLTMFNTPRANMGGGGGGIWAKLVKNQLFEFVVVEHFPKCAIIVHTIYRRGCPKIK